MFKKKKKYYYVELEYAKSAEDIFTSHLVCESDKKHIELSGIISNLGNDITEWRFLSITEIDPEDAIKLNKLLEEGPPGDSR